MRLVRHMNAGNLWSLPEASSAPQDPVEQVAALIALGVEGLQHPLVEMLPEGPLARVGMGRVDAPEDAERLAKAHKALGCPLTTLHVGTGLETDAEIDRLVAAVLEASAKHAYPMPIETHRATVTQDLRRTLDMIDRFPDVRFNADLSHWYTGHEMTYGDIARKFDALEPVFQRVRYLHGRIGTPCCAQVPLKDADDDRPFVDHFREMWRRCFKGFLETASPQETLPFAPELLPYEVAFGDTVHPLYYARRMGDGSDVTEESDRWGQAEILWRIAEACAAEVGLQTARAH